MEACKHLDKEYQCRNRAKVVDEWNEIKIFDEIGMYYEGMCKDCENYEKDSSKM
jgi:hypothetical protein